MSKSRPRLITNDKEKRKRLGNDASIPKKPICSICNSTCHKVTIDRGSKIANEAGIERFDKIGWWCDPCLHFYQTKQRRKVIEKRGKLIIQGK